MITTHTLKIPSTYRSIFNNCPEILTLSITLGEDSIIILDRKAIEQHNNDIDIEEYPYHLLPETWFIPIKKEPSVFEKLIEDILKHDNNFFMLTLKTNLGDYQFIVPLFAPTFEITRADLQRVSLKLRLKEIDLKSKITSYNLKTS
jgi:hypothetical protein